MLHLIKLCVGADSIADLEDWIARRLSETGRPHHVHTTRQMPKRRDEILEGGSLYWVIRGTLACRQRIVGLDERVGGDGISRCDIALERMVVQVDPRKKGPFQGWRYLVPGEAPADLDAAALAADLPLELQRELRQIGVV